MEIGRKEGGVEADNEAIMMRREIAFHFFICECVCVCVCECECECLCVYACMMAQRCWSVKINLEGPHFRLSLNVGSEKVPLLPPSVFCLPLLLPSLPPSLSPSRAPFKPPFDSACKM